MGDNFYAMFTRVMSAYFSIIMLAGDESQCWPELVINGDLCCLAGRATTKQWGFILSLKVHNNKGLPSCFHSEANSLECGLQRFTVFFPGESRALPHMF